MASLLRVATINLERFNGFVWCVEDHDLHSSNHLHMGADKTGYGMTKVGKLLEREFEKSKHYSLNCIV